MLPGERALCETYEVSRTTLRKAIVDKVAYWSGVQRPIVKRLVEAICKRVEDLGLRVDVRRESDYLTEFTVYTTALSMNYLARGKFIQP